ncbi:MAG TPA: hypothetical protein VMR74_16660 [Gammaproteobacteria bacterium]|nr:hypothetical protein [Gammaproteobacteria bacterium]
MSARTRQPGFLAEATFGLVISLVAAAVALTLSFVMPGAIVARLIVAGLGLTLVLRAIGRSSERRGRVVTVVVWLAVAAGIWVVGVSLPTYVAVHVALAWLARSLFSCSRLIEAGLDLGLTLLALSFAIFAAVRTESVFLATWCFLLVQAFQASIPDLAARMTASGERDVPANDPNHGFAEAFKAADEALHRIAGRR